MVTVSLQEKNGVYQAVLNYKDNNGKRKQKWKSTGLAVRGNKRLALQKADEIRKEFEEELELISLNHSKSKVIKDILFVDYMKNWLKIVKPTIALNTYGSYEQMINYRINDYFTTHQIRLKELQPIHIQDFYTSMLNDNLSSNTVIHYHAVIRKSLDYAFKMDMIQSNPADKVQRPKMQQFIGSFYNESELNTLFEKSKGEPLELIIFITAFYGLRRSEVAGLKWNAIDFENNTITIKHTLVQVSIKGQRQVIGKNKTKNKTSYRTLPLVPEVTEVLKKFKQMQENNKKSYKKSYNSKYEEYLCVDNLGNIIAPDFITKHFRRLLKNSNLKIIRFHDLRHSCASLLLARGIPLKEIQAWLVHSNFNTTANIYAHLDTNVKQKSADVLSNILKGQKNISNCEELDIC